MRSPELRWGRGVTPLLEFPSRYQKLLLPSFDVAGVALIGVVVMKEQRRSGRASSPRPLPLSFMTLSALALGVLWVKASPLHMTEYKAQGNVQFLGVARFQDRAIVASHAYNTVIDLNGVKEVIKSDQLSVRPGVHFSFSSGGSAWHLMSGE